VEVVVVVVAVDELRESLVIHPTTRTTVCAGLVGRARPTVLDRRRSPTFGGWRALLSALSSSIDSTHVILCYAMLCHVMPCHVM
jgi:hypothetical protein